MNARAGTAVDSKTPSDHAVLVPVLLTVLDRAVTLPYWSHEANPLVKGLGQAEWLLVTAGCLGGLTAVWYLAGLYRYRACKAWIGGLSVLTFAVVVSNVWVLVS